MTHRVSRSGRFLIAVVALALGAGCDRVTGPGESWKQDGESLVVLTPMKVHTVEARTGEILRTSSVGFGGWDWIRIVQARCGHPSEFFAYLRDGGDGSQWLLRFDAAAHRLRRVIEFDEIASRSGDVELSPLAVPLAGHCERMYFANPVEPHRLVAVDVLTWTPVASANVPGPLTLVPAGAVGPRGALAVFREDTVHFLDPESLEEIASVRLAAPDGLPETITGVGASPDGSRLFAAGRRFLFRIDLPSMEIDATAPVPDVSPYAFRGLGIVVGEGTGNVHLFNQSFTEVSHYLEYDEALNPLRSVELREQFGRELQNARLYRGEAPGVVYLASGRSGATTTYLSNARLTRIENGRFTRTIDFGYEATPSIVPLR